MKTLWCVGLMLLLAVQARAGGSDIVMPAPYSPGPICIDRDRNVIQCPPRCQDGEMDQSKCGVYRKPDRDDHERFKIIERYPESQTSDPCLAQMEQAMRAMDLYVEWFTGLSGPDINFDNKQQIRLLAKTYQQWKAAKRDCWRTP